MRVGLVGFSGSGKSTLFELLTGARPDPGKVHSGQVGVATLSDPRLDFLAAMHKPKKVTSATVEMLDTPGLMPGSHGDNPQRLALIREGDALLIVLGAFAGGDPAADLAAFRDEMLFADLGVVTNRAERLEASVKKPRPDREAAAQGAGRRQAGPGRARERRADRLARPDRGGEEADAVVRPADRQAAGRPRQPHAGRRDPRLAARPSPPTPWRSTPSWSWSCRSSTRPSATAFMADMGITEMGRDRIIRKAYDAVGIITFFTAGEPEVRGWNVERGGSAVDAAGKIHTDLAKGFIRAEVTAFDDLARARHDEGGQGQEPPAPRRQGLRRQGRRHHVLPERALTDRAAAESQTASRGPQDRARRRRGSSGRSRRSRLASQRVFGRRPTP